MVVRGTELQNLSPRFESQCLQTRDLFSSALPSCHPSQLCFPVALKMCDGRCHHRQNCGERCNLHCCLQALVMVQTYFGNIGWGWGRLLQAIETAQRVKGLAGKPSNLNPSLEPMRLCKPDEVSLIPRTYMKAEGENQPYRTILQPLHTPSAGAQTHMRTHVHTHTPKDHGDAQWAKAPAVKHSALCSVFSQSTHGRRKNQL